MVVKIFNSLQETATVCLNCFLNYKEGTLSFMFENDQLARDSEMLIRQCGGKTTHRNKTIILTNLSDFEFVFE